MKLKKEKKKKEKSKKIKRRKNPRVTKLLQGEDIIFETEKQYESDNCYENDYHKKIDKKNKSQESGEDTLFDNKIIPNNENKKIYHKKEIKQEKTNELIENSKQDSEDEENKEKKLNERKKRKTRFIQSLTKKDSQNKEDDSKYGKEEDYKNARLKTDFNDDAKKTIKTTLKYIGKDGISSDEEEEHSSSFVKKANYKSLNSITSEKNKLMGNQNMNKLNMFDKESEDKNALKSGKKKILIFQEEGSYKGDNLIPKGNKKKKNIKKRKLKNKKGEQVDIKESENLDEKLDQLNNQNKKSDFDIFYEKALGSSIASFLNTGGDKVFIEENICVYYWKYFKKRELFIVSFFDKKDTIPFFIRWSAFFFSLLFIFLLNCFFFFEKNVHKRYLNALEGKNNNIKFYFKHEFVNSIYVSLIAVVFKMIIIKLVFYRAFKIKKKTKKMMNHSYEEKLGSTELEDLEQKRIDYLVLYHIKIIIYFCLLILLSLFFAYICVCYGGVFENSINAFFLGFLFSFILSFVLCALICFIIVLINKISRMLKNRCLLSAYVVLSTVY